MLAFVDGAPGRTADVELPRRQQGMRLAVTLRANGQSQPAMMNDVYEGGAGLTGAIGLSVDQPIVVELVNGRCISAKIVSRGQGQSDVAFMEPLALNDSLLRLAGRRV